MSIYWVYISVRKSSDSCQLIKIRFIAKLFNNTAWMGVVNIFTFDETVSPESPASIFSSIGFLAEAYSKAEFLLISFLLPVQHTYFYFIETWRLERWEAIPLSPKWRLCVASWSSRQDSFHRKTGPRRKLIFSMGWTSLDNWYFFQCSAVQWNGSFFNSFLTCSLVNLEILKSFKGSWLTVCLWYSIIKWYVRHCIAMPSHSFH